MIDHVGLTVSNIEKSKEFYKLALAPLGFKLLAEVPASMTGGKDLLALVSHQNLSFGLVEEHQTTHQFMLPFKQALVRKWIAFIKQRFLLAAVITGRLAFAPITIRTIMELLFLMMTVTTLRLYVM